MGISRQDQMTMMIRADAASRRYASSQIGGGFQDIIAQMQAAQEKANLVNEQRYQQILGTFENLGKAGRARIEQQTTQRQAAATQNLTSRGLGGTTITSAVERGIASDAETQRQQLEEGIAVQRAGVMERRTDTGPDLGMFASLLQMAGQQQQQPSRAIIRRMGASTIPRAEQVAPQTSSRTRAQRSRPSTSMGTGPDIWKRRLAAGTLRRQQFTGGSTFIRGGMVN